MSQPFSSTDDPWARLPSFERDGVVVHITTYAGDDHSAATTVFTSRSSSEVFHADKHCHRLHRSDTIRTTDGERRWIKALPLERVMTSWLNPIRPCNYCTQDIHTTAEIAQEYDNVPEVCLKYYEPGDSVVKTKVRTDPESGETSVRESSRPAYPSGGDDA
jgi:hypothetical protein